MRRSPTYAFFILFLLLSACSLGTESSSSRGNAPPPGSPAKLEKNAESSTMDAFRAIAKPEGLKFKQLFGERISNKDQRMARLEKAVQELRNDFDTVVPTMVRLVSVEKDMKDLVTQLQDLGDDKAAVPVEKVEQVPITIPGEDVARGTDPVQQPEEAYRAGTAATISSSVTPEAASSGPKPPEGAASPNSKAETPVPPAVPSKVEALAKEIVAPVTVAPKPESLGISATSVRIGDHKDKTRIVIDMTGSAAPKASLAKNNRQLVIDMPNITWATAQSWIADSGMLIAQWKYEEGKLYIDLIAPSAIKTQSVIAPKEGVSGYRFVLDVVGQGVHK